MIKIGKQDGPKMIFGRIGACKAAFLVVLAAIIGASCGAMRIPHEYMIDVDKQMLRAYDPKLDLPLTYCVKEVCYAYPDAEVRRIKKYVSELEQRLKKCEK